SRQLGTHAAVADEGDDDPVGVGQLDAYRRGRAEAHRRGAARGDEPPGLRQWVALRDTVLVPPDIGDQDGVRWQRGPHIGEDPLGPKRELIATAPVSTRVKQGCTRRMDSLPQLRPRHTLGPMPHNRAEYRPDRERGVGYHAYLDRVVATDLGRIDVDLDQASRWEPPGVVGMPRARIGFGEP